MQDDTAVSRAPRLPTSVQDAALQMKLANHHNYLVETVQNCLFMISVLSV